MKKMTLRQKLAKVLMVEIIPSNPLEHMNELNFLIKKIEFSNFLISGEFEEILEKGGLNLKAILPSTSALYYKIYSKKLTRKLSFFSGVKLNNSLKKTLTDFVILDSEAYGSEFVYGLSDEKMIVSKKIKELESDKMGFSSITNQDKKNRNIYLLENNNIMLKSIKSIKVELKKENNSKLHPNVAQEISTSILSGIDIVLIPYKFKNCGQIEKIESIFNQLYLMCIKDRQLEYAVSNACNRIIMYYEEFASQNNSMNPLENMVNYKVYESEYYYN